MGGVTTVYQSFALCGASQAPRANGYVSVQRLDALGQPTSGAAPADVQFTGVVGHFSTWGVALVQPRVRTPATLAAAARLHRRARPLNWTVWRCWAAAC